MHTRIYLILTLLIFILPFKLQAEEIEKKISFGFGTYSLSVSHADLFQSDKTLTLSGTAFSASYAMSNNIAFRGSFFSLTDDDFPDVDSSGVDIIALFGSGFTTQGFNGYLGAGIFIDRWKNANENQHLDGTQLNAGIGYNWEALSLNLLFGLRESGEYDNQGNSFTAVVSSSFSLSVRF